MCWLLNTNQPNTPTSNKSSGFTEEEYYTYNVALKKEVVGPLADKTYEFGFDVVINDGLHTGQTYKKNNDSDYSTVNSTSQKINLKHGETCTFYGLSQLATIHYVEDNYTDSAGNVYTVAITGATNVDGSAIDFGNAPNNSTVLKVTAATTDTLSAARPAEINNNIIFTNSLNQVSPTGVALRFGPYLIMAAAAVVLLLIMARRRKDGDSGIAI